MSDFTDHTAVSADPHKDVRLQVAIPLLAFHRNERGMMSVANCVCVMLSALLFSATINNCYQSSQKMAKQTTADGVGMTAGAWMARGMNAITATNHLMGEMLSLVVLHEAIGGKKLENGTSADVGDNHSIFLGHEQQLLPPRVLKKLDQDLKLAYDAARQFNSSLGVFAAMEPNFQLVYERSTGGRTKIKAEATLLDSKKKLKEKLTQVYQGKTIAGLMIESRYPPVVAAGQALAAAMHAIEMKIMQEYLTLQALTGVALNLLPMKKLLRDQLLPSAKRYTTDIVRNTPVMARKAAIAVGSRMFVTADVFPVPGQLRLPVVMDPIAVHFRPLKLDDVVEEPDANDCGCPTDQPASERDKGQLGKVSQLGRATFPWVNYHRHPLLNTLGATLTLSGAKDHYFHWTNGYSKSILVEQQTGDPDDPDGHLGLYVLEGYNGVDKGYERWTVAENSHEADDLFTLIGLTYDPADMVLGRPIFDQEHPDGSVAWSMVLLYNSNEQQRPNHRVDLTCKRIVPPRQANVGMDTLNWHPGSLQNSENCAQATGDQLQQREGEYRPFELLGKGLPPEYPRVKLGWQAKLVPTTSHQLARLKKAVLPTPFESVTQRMPDNVPRSMTTH